MNDDRPGITSEEVRQAYDQLLSVARDECGDQAACYRLMREMMEQLCRLLSPESSLQLTDLAARIRYVASRLSLSPAEEYRLHTLRLNSNRVLHRELEVDKETLMYDVKTLAELVGRVSRQDAPDSLRRALPQGRPARATTPLPKARRRRMRVIFVRSDDDFLYVMPTESLSDKLLRVRRGVEKVNDAFDRTCAELWPNAQLNLLEVDVADDETLTPGFIVLEPDYLIEVSSLAECYRDFGSHPANYALSRLQPRSRALPLLVGNIVNLFLDEWLHTEDEPDYKSCMRKAFAQFALELTACPELKDAGREKNFFSDCAMHFDHLRETVTQTFNDPAYALRPGDALIEPAFVCEALGLQGRLDYMQRDRTAFIEMKSGRADEYAQRGKVVPKENNLVQMLLYMAMMEFSLGVDHRHVRAYLLYTRYPLLYPSPPEWSKVKRAIDLRNRIVANEYYVQRHNNIDYTARRLSEINPETLNEKGISGKFWDQYLKPGIETVRDELLSLTPVERSYFYSVYNFITKELYTTKSGDTSYDGGRPGHASAYLSSAAEKLQEGEMFVDLRMLENHAAEAERPYLVFGIPHSEERRSSVQPNFRTGDTVVVYQRDGEADNATNRQVFKGNIDELTSGSIRVRLRSTQRNGAVLPGDRLYAIEHDTMDTNFRAMYAGLSLFLTTTQDRRDLLLGQRLPRSGYNAATVAEGEAATRPDGGAGNDIDRIIHKARAANDYFLLVGPPGTGKTSRALRGMVEAFGAEGKELLLLAYTNRAVDEVCRMLSRISPEVDYLRLGSEMTCEQAYRAHLVGQVLSACPTRREVERRISECHIFVGTVSMLSLHTELFDLKHFDVAIVDEASQLLEPQLLGLLCHIATDGTCSIKKFILIGDHKQLPAVVGQAEKQSRVSDPLLNAIGLLNLRDSLFERLHRHLVEVERATDGARSAAPFVDMLCRQGRMHPDIAEFPSRAFYEGKLTSLQLPHQVGHLPPRQGELTGEPTDLLSRRLAFIPSVAGPSPTAYKSNTSEARIVARLSRAVYLQSLADGSFDESATLGIIAPYRSQIACIRAELEATGIEALTHITVDTVERYQGSERDVIIYSFCVNRPSQLRQLVNVTVDDGVRIDRKLNVALTRARRQLFLTGVPELLRLNDIYARLLDFISENSTPREA